MLAVRVGDTRAVMSAHRRAAARLRFDWGLPGAVAVAKDVAVVVDVLSFTTTLTVALDAGISVLPYRWDDRGLPSSTPATMTPCLRSAGLRLLPRNSVCHPGRSATRPSRRRGWCCRISLLWWRPSTAESLI